MDGTSIEIEQVHQSQEGRDQNPGDDLVNLPGSEA
jgi:hypothetical protein